MATTEILPSHDRLSHHQPRPRKSSPTSSSIFLGGSPPSLSSSPKATFSPPPIEHHEDVSKPEPSFDRTDSIADSASIHSLNSTPRSSGLSLQTDLTADDDIDFPNYEMHFLTPDKDADADSASKSTDDDTEVPEISTTTDTTRSDSPIHTPTVADDTAIREEPSQHVDYLSHNWREEDIWASWRHIVSQRRVYGQKSRLENASWRTWAKSKYRLKTISPETLNWLKESDVTWLYGPLKPAQSRPITSSTDNSSSQISKNSSFINKKPILKKRSVSEVMLQKSLSTSSLVKQAAASVQEQQRKPIRSGLNRTASDLHSSSPWTAPSVPPSRDDYFSSRTSSVSGTPSEGREERHIRFDEKVEQCIAVECKEPSFDDDDSEPEPEEDPPNSALSDSSSDDGIIMMGNRNRKSNKSGSDGKGRLSRTNSMNNSMIETIPATTLKNRTDSPDVTAEAQHHVFGKNWSSGTLNPSPSQETLRPARPSRNFLLADHEDDDEDDTNSSSWSFGASNPKSSLGASAGPSIEERDFGYEGIEGMRRTESGMFMPYSDEDEDDLVAAGLFGRVSETINTVRDIGYVLWNVGFRNGSEQNHGSR